MKFANTTERQYYRDNRIARVIRGLLACIPDEGDLSRGSCGLTHEQMERRIRAAQKFLKDEGL